jgi:hypothetical protein
VALWDRWVLAQTRQEACDRLETAVMRPSGTRDNKTTKQIIFQFCFQQHPHDDEQHDHGHMDGIFQHSTFRSILLLIALSFHSVFEGLAIGLQQELGQLISLFMAVIIHKAVMAFSLGLTLAQSNLNFCQFVVGNLIFSGLIFNFFPKFLNIFLKSEILVIFLNRNSHLCFLLIYF